MSCLCAAEMWTLTQVDRDRIHALEKNGKDKLDSVR